MFELRWLKSRGEMFLQFRTRALKMSRSGIIRGTGDWGAWLDVPHVELPPIMDINSDVAD